MSPDSTTLSMRGRIHERPEPSDIPTCRELVARALDAQANNAPEFSGRVVP